RQAAVLALGEIKDTGSVPALMQALGDADWYVRAEAATALGKIGDARATEPLLAALSDADNYVRENARRALFELATPDNLPAFQKSLQNQETVHPPHGRRGPGPRRQCRWVGDPHRLPQGRQPQ
ncbi:MAG: HEAT repeat domain-containing protein, partial [Bdellovibrionaceae bacterium]|nr:HEAT repeat domain-containing protein [Pseudobdellovibrionaceae bacterium]